MNDDPGSGRRPLCWWVLGGLLVVNALWWLLAEMPRILRYPFGLDFGEGILLNQARMLLHRQPIYGPIDHPPYLVANYPPLFPVASAILQKLFATAPGLLLGRSLSVLGTVGIVAVLVILARRHSKGPCWVGLLPLCWLVTAPAWRWGLVMRVDPLGIAFTLAGLTAATCLEPRWRKLAAVFLQFGMQTKHSLLSAPATWLAEGFRTPELKRERLRQLAVMVGVFLLIDLISKGGLFRHILLYTANEFHPMRLLAGLEEFLALTLPLWGLVFLGLALHGRAAWEDPQRRPFLIYLPLATVTLVTFGATGSDSNYYLEPIAAMLAATIVLFGAGESEQNRSYDRASSGLAVLLLIAFVIGARWSHSADFPLLQNPAANRRGGEEIVKLLATTPDPVLSEEFTFTLAAGKTPDFQPYIFRLLSEKAKWDERPFLADLVQGKYGVIVLKSNLFQPENPEEAGQDPLGAGFDRLTPAMEEAIRLRYRLLRGAPFYSNGGYYVYVRREPHGQ